MRMSRDYKICKNCGAKVDINANFCTECKSQSFDVQPSGVRSSQPSSFKQALFYWNYDGHLVLAKSKVMGFLVFIYIAMNIFASPVPAGMFLLAIIFAAATFIIGFVIHAIRGRPSQAVIENSDWGLGRDLIHFLFFWQNKYTGEYVLSKTKVISVLIFIVFMLLAAITNAGEVLFVYVTVGLIFEIPVYTVGYIIHKLTNPNPVNPEKIETRKQAEKLPKQEKSRIGTIFRTRKTDRIEVIPKFQEYEDKVNELKGEFDAKQNVARDLIEKKFTPPQITYTRFISMVDKAGEIFDKESDSALNILHLATEDSQRIDTELDSKITIMESIIDKIDDLTDELILSMDSSDDGDVETLIEDMGDLISSVKDYEK